MAAIVSVYRLLNLSFSASPVDPLKAPKMPPPLSDAQKNRIVQHIVNGLDVVSIVEAEHVSGSTVYRIIDNLHAFGTHTAPNKNKGGRPVKVSPAARSELRSYVESKPWAYQEEMQHELLDRFGISVSQPTISKTLHAMKISRKSWRRRDLGRAGAKPDLTSILQTQAMMLHNAGDQPSSDPMSACQERSHAYIQGTAAEPSVPKDSSLGSAPVSTK